MAEQAAREAVEAQSGICLMIDHLLRLQEPAPLEVRVVTSTMSRPAGEQTCRPAPVPLETTGLADKRQMITSSKKCASVTQDGESPGILETQATV